MANRIWIDVEDLFIYAESGARPSGIQRVEFELSRALARHPETKERISFVRHDAARRSLATVPWEEVEAIYESMSNGDPAPRRLRQKRHPLVIRTIWSIVKKVISRLPPLLGEAALLQVNVFLCITRFAAGMFHGSRRQPSNLMADSTAFTDHFAKTAELGDIVAVLGGPWITPDYSSYVERAVRERRLRFAILIHDIISLRRPEWFGRTTANAFQMWFDRAITRADVILTVSVATAYDVDTYAQEKGVPLRSAPKAIPLGTGFKRSQHRLTGSARRRWLPAPDGYALMVSTIEVRKNHALLLRVWRRLLDEMPAPLVPTLVFAGRIGWLVHDLMGQLHNSDFLDGKIIHIDSPTDEELAALYEGCLFTLFPSFYEGWGLPVTESLAFGRPCIISKATSLPEAGGSLARYIDPDNATDAYRVIRETIEDQAGLRAWRDRVQREFRPVEWCQSARAALQVLDATEDELRTPKTKARRVHQHIRV